MAEPAPVRAVPGAPPPKPLTKSQLKKKRKTKSKAETDAPVTIPDITSAALVEKAPEPADLQEGNVAPELVVQPEAQAPQLPEEDAVVKPSPIVDLITKRLKATTKKIVCVMSELKRTRNVDSHLVVANNYLRVYRSRKTERRPKAHSQDSSWSRSSSERAWRSQKGC